MNGAHVARDSVTSFPTPREEVFGSLTMIQGRASRCNENQRQEPKHTILPVLDTRQSLKTSPIKGSKRLADEGRHG